MISNSNIPASAADKQHHNNGTTENTNDAAKIMRALNVEEIDIDLYQSIELWHPAGSRGAFGGQVHFLSTSYIFSRMDGTDTIVYILDGSSSIASWMEYCI